MSNEEIDRAQLVIRALQGGLEPYAAAVSPMALDLRDAAFRAEVIAGLEALLVTGDGRALDYVTRALAALRDG